ncbi:MAG: GGDEF domain-containing protein [Acidobacteria bacterium]|nr:GGDEF domain-containing protein [Acidobacteriota bacterium]
MKNPQISVFSGKIVGSSIILTAVFSLTVIGTTFFVSNSGLSFELKLGICLGTVAAYLFVCAGFYYWQRGRLANLQAEQAAAAVSGEIEGKLLVLEEANEFFGASLKTSDMFRLVASRIDEIVPFSGCALFLRDDKDNVLRIQYAVGEHSRELMNFRGNTNKGLAVKAFLSSRSQTDPTLVYEKRVFPPELLAGFRSAAAVPLQNRGETYGVLVLYFKPEDAFGEGSETLLRAVGERVAPLFANSFAFEKNLSNALTDGLTNLPNERGFFLVLENQLAEAQRYRDERALTVLAMDVRNFAEINRKYGHAAGDRLLAFAASIIRKQLRQMDVLTRSAGDEFLAILPTAGEKIGEDVVERIKRAFVSAAFQMSARENIHLEINFGAATFWRDGETADALLKTALLRKSQDKSADPGKVIWFPKEFVN